MPRAAIWSKTILYHREFKDDSRNVMGTRIRIKIARNPGGDQTPDEDGSRERSGNWGEHSIDVQEESKKEGVIPTRGHAVSRR